MNKFGTMYLLLFFLCGCASSSASRNFEDVSRTDRGDVRQPAQASVDLLKAPGRYLQEEEKREYFQFVNHHETLTEPQKLALGMGLQKYLVISCGADIWGAATVTVTSSSALGHWAYIHTDSDCQNKSLEFIALRFGRSCDLTRFFEYGYPFN